MESMPDRVSNSGPDSSDSEMDWRDHLSEAEAEARYASRIDRDNSSVEYKLRKAAIEEAIAHLQNAIEKLPGEVHHG
jgi:hypothetical protein